MSSPETNDLAAVVEALRSHDRFLVTTHENPDGDALGSLLAARLGLEQLGKDAVMALHGDAPLPGEYAFMELDDLRREWPQDAQTRVPPPLAPQADRKSTRLNSSHTVIS